VLRKKSPTLKGLQPAGLRVQCANGSGNSLPKTDGRGENSPIELAPCAPEPERGHSCPQPGDQPAGSIFFRHRSSCSLSHRMGEGRGENSPKNSRIEPPNPGFHKLLHDKDKQFWVRGEGKARSSFFQVHGEGEARSMMDRRPLSEVVCLLLRPLPQPRKSPIANNRTCFTFENRS